jgi:arylsulfatase A-like enzyme
MQAAAPEAVDLSREPERIKEEYGLNRPECADYGHRCLLARRLVERGVRFVQIYCGSGSQWDAHSDLENNHRRMCTRCDQPTAALLRDLKRRGLLDSTLVIWGGEFGRTPMSEGSNGRDHNPYGFSMWLAGGGVKGGQVVGATDEFGVRAVENRAHVHDLHATILHLLGLRHDRLTFLHNGRDERLTENGGRVIRELLL